MEGCVNDFDILPQSFPNVSPLQLSVSTKQCHLPRNYAKVNKGQDSASEALHCVPCVCSSQLIVDLSMTDVTSFNMQENKLELVLINNNQQALVS